MSDPSNGLQRLDGCPVCDYALTGLPGSGVCPECGFEYDDHMYLLRSPAVSAISPLVGALAFAVIAITYLSTGGWVAGGIWSALAATILATLLWRWHSIGWKGNAVRTLITSEGIWTGRGPFLAKYLTSSVAHEGLRPWGDYSLAILRRPFWTIFRTNTDRHPWCMVIGQPWHQLWRGSNDTFWFVATMTEANAIQKDIESRIRVAKSADPACSAPPPR